MRAPVSAPPTAWVKSVGMMAAEVSAVPVAMATTSPAWQTEPADAPHSAKEKHAEMMAVAARAGSALQTKHATLADNAMAASPRAWALSAATTAAAESAETAAPMAPARAASAAALRAVMAKAAETMDAMAAAAPVRTMSSAAHKGPASALRTASARSAGTTGVAVSVADAQLVRAAQGLVNVSMLPPMSQVGWGPTAAPPRPAPQSCLTRSPGS